MSGHTQMLVLCLVSSALAFVLATQASEAESESVEVTFYQLSPSEWTSSEFSFKTLVKAEATTYCSNNAATCGFNSSSTFVFRESDVRVYSGPTEESTSLKISFYIKFPTQHILATPAVTSYVLNSAAVTTILTNIRNSLESAVGADITYIGDEFYGIDPDETLNKVLIPVVFIVLLAIIILAVALHMWNKRKEQMAKKKQRALDREKRNKMSRVMPVHIMENDTKKLGNFIPERSRKQKTVIQDTRQQTTNGNIPTISVKTNMMTYDSNRNIGETALTLGEKAPHYDDPVPLRNNALPSLPNPGFQEEMKEQQQRKREKKEKRRRKREKRQQEGAGEGGREESESEFFKD